MKRAGHHQGKFWDRRLEKLCIFADTEKVPSHGAHRGR